MDAMSEIMVLKRKHSPTPQDWDNTSEHNEEPASPSSSTDEVCCESTKPKKKRKKQVKFNGVTVYYFQRSQGFTCVPSQGGSTLGMEHIHDFKENYSLNGFALEQDRQHRQMLKEQLLERKQRQMLEQSDPELLNKSIQEIAENELAKINVEEYYFLQPVATKRRRLMLRSAGVKKIESWEKSELKMIRLSREKCGCDCKVVCNPSTCACSIAGIKCQVDRLSFPCGCSKDGCGNNTGRVEFNPIKVRTHFLHTLMRLEVENGQDNDVEYGMVVSRTDKETDRQTDKEASYTKLENSVCLDESSDRVLDHGQCKECDSIPYTDYSDQYASSQFMNGQNTAGLHAGFIQQLDNTMYSNSICTPVNFSCTNSNIPLDLQSNSQIPCVVSYDDESKHSTLNSSVNNSCNVPRSAVNEYDSSTSEESASSESESDSPYINSTMTLDNTGFDSITTKTHSIFQTPDSSPDQQQFTKLMPLDLSHADYDTCDDSPTYTQLSSRTCSGSSHVSEMPTMSSQASLYTDYVGDCQHLTFNACKGEKSHAEERLNTIALCNLTGQSDLFGNYNLDNSHHTIATENNNSTLPPIKHPESPLYVDDNTIEYLNASVPAENNMLNDVDEFVLLNTPTEETALSNDPAGNILNDMDEFVLLNAPVEVASDASSIQECAPFNSTELLDSSSRLEECGLSNGILTNHETHNQSYEMVDDSQPSKLDDTSPDCVVDNSLPSKLDDTSPDRLVDDSLLSKRDGTSPDCVVDNSLPSKLDGTSPDCVVGEFLLPTPIVKSLPIMKDLTSDCLTAACKDSVTSIGVSEALSGEHLPSNKMFKESQTSIGVSEALSGEHLPSNEIFKESQSSIGVSEALSGEHLPSNEIFKESQSSIGVSEALSGEHLPSNEIFKESQSLIGVSETRSGEHLPSNEIFKESQSSIGVSEALSGEHLPSNEIFKESQSSIGVSKALSGEHLPSNEIFKESQSSIGVSEALSGEHLPSNEIFKESQSLIGVSEALSGEHLPSNEIFKESQSSIGVSEALSGEHLPSNEIFKESQSSIGVSEALSGEHLPSNEIFKESQSLIGVSEALSDEHLPSNEIFKESQSSIGVSEALSGEHLPSNEIFKESQSSIGVSEALSGEHLPSNEIFKESQSSIGVSEALSGEHLPSNEIFKESQTSIGVSEALSGEHLPSNEILESSVGIGEENHHLEHTVTSTVSDPV